MVSLKDIAKTCGVSVATVSKAINNQKDVGEETKKRICDVAKQMGYLPNAQARALKTNRSYNLGVLFVDEARSGLTHDYFAKVLDSFKRTAEERGYDITFINCSKNNGRSMSYLERCKYRGFDGVVIACVDFNAPEIIELVQSDIPVVTIDHLFQDTMTIISDNVKGMRELLTYIYECGHRKIAYIHGAPSSVTHNRLTSFYRTADELGLEIKEYHIKEAAYRDTKAAEKMTYELLDHKDRPTCIIYPDDFSAFGGMNAIRDRGLKIPQDISVAGYDGIEIAKKIEPKLTTIEQDTEKMGFYAAERLIEMIEHPRMTVIEQIVVNGKLVEGKSIKRI